jgi:APA family basic amino acid/polyamine antiporter
MTTGPDSSPSFVRGLTLLGAVALIVGNRVGTSIYTLPASLAKDVGPLGLVAWVVTAAGYLFVALVYARLGTRMPRTGGPSVFARAAFGDFAAFLVVWSYWFSAVIGNAAIAFGVVGYVAGFSAGMEDSPPAQFLAAQAILWGLCLVNVLGVKHSARLQIAILFANVVPLLVIALLALPSFDSANLQPFAPHGIGALPLGISLIVWAYSGIESATVPAEEVAAPERTIRLGTMLGYAVGTLVFLLAAVAVAGVLPNDVAASSARPIALAAERTVGAWGAWVIAVVAIAAGLGTLNGWILMAGRIPVSAASDGLFFAAFGRIHPRYKTPTLSLVIGTVIASIMLTLVLRKSLLDAFGWVVGLALLTTLVPHLVVMAADFVLARRAVPALAPAERRRASITAVVGFVFVAFTIYGLGPEAWLWGALVIALGVPLYFVLKRRPAGR